MDDLPLRLQTWTDIWPLPVAGLACLVHMRYRRYCPRTLPTLTPLKPFEIYVAISTSYTIYLAALRQKRELLCDQNLLMVEIVARLARGKWKHTPYRKKDIWNKPEFRESEHIPCATIYHAE